MSDRLSIEPFKAEIPAEALAKLQELQTVKVHRAATFEPWQDEVLLRYWRAGSGYRQTDLVKVVGFSLGVCRKRYEQLIAEDK